MLHTQSIHVGERLYKQENNINKLILDTEVWSFLQSSTKLYCKFNIRLSYQHACDFKVCMYNFIIVIYNLL